MSCSTFLLICGLLYRKIMGRNKDINLHVWIREFILYFVLRCQRVDELNYIGCNYYLIPNIAWFFKTKRRKLHFLSLPNQAFGLGFILPSALLAKVSTIFKEKEDLHHISCLGKKPPLIWHQTLYKLEGALLTLTSVNNRL